MLHESSMKESSPIFFTTPRTAQLVLEGKEYKRNDSHTILDVLRQGRVRLTNSIQTKAEFSYAIAVMYRIGGCNEADDEGSQIGAIFAASMWIYTKAVACNGQQHMENLRINTMNSIMEAVSWVCAYFQEDHDWISEFSLAQQEKTQIWRLRIVTSMFPVLCNEGCCGIQRRPASTMTC